MFYTTPFDTALLVGRFNIMHKGHESLVNMALSMCDRILIFVGSAQESGTLRNPFDVGTRMNMIKTIYPQDNVIVVPLPDLTNEDDIRPEWGDYVMDNIYRHIYKKPDVMIYGNDESRSAWFGKDVLTNVTEVIVNRNNYPISATMMRELMAKDDKTEWFKHHNPKVHRYFDELRGKLMACTPYQELYKK